MLRAVWLCVTLPFLLASQAPADADLRQALSLFNTGRYEECYQDLTLYITGHPSSAPGYKVLGMTEFMLGRPEQAREHLRRATELSPKDAEAFYYLGRLYFSADNPTAAAANFRHALELDPSSVRARNHLGQSLEALGRPAEAEEAYRQAIALEQTQSRKSEWPFYNLALLEFHNGKTAESIGHFRAALECNPKFVTARIKLAVALAAMGEDGEAEKLLQDAIQMERSNAEAHYRLAIVLRKAGRQQEAAEQFALFEKLQKP